MLHRLTLLAAQVALGALFCHSAAPALADYSGIAQCGAAVGASLCDFNAELRTRPEVPRSGEPATMEFTLTDGSGQLVTDLQTHHARKLHVVIIGADMGVLGHVHPVDFDESIEAGRGRVSFTFPRPGRYLIAADVMTGAGPHAATFFVDVADPGANKPPYVAPAAASLRVVDLQPNDRYVEPVLLGEGHRVDGYEVEMRIAERAEAGKPTSLVYRFSHDGSPITDLRPYLDAPMHLAVVKEDLSRFLHQHGSVPGTESHGHSGHGAAHHGHGTVASGRFGPAVAASVQFPEPGRYYLFGQTARGNELLVFRTTVLVE